MKRVLDVVLSLTALVLLAPLMLVVAVAIALHDGPPVFFRQQRVGLNGREFGMFKFRSMVKNASSIGPYFTVAEDRRITPVGRLIRRTSVDEVPQIINVLLGDMSLVGPRPDVMAQRGQYSHDQWKERCSVRPGITGLAQALLRSECTQAERCEMDLRYVRQVGGLPGLWLDFKIMFWTLGRLSGKGSN